MLPSIFSMQKALELMNLKLAHVVSDIAGRTGLAIIRAILDGQRDPRALATLRDPHCKADAATIARAGGQLACGVFVRVAPSSGTSRVLPKADRGVRSRDRGATHALRGQTRRA